MNPAQWQNIINRTYSVEFDWFAIDKNGHVGVFSSLNQAPIPNAVLQTLEVYQKQAEAIALLPKTGKAKLFFGGNLNDWKRYAENGLFAYDYRDAHRSNKLNHYDLVAIPSKPISVQCLPVDIIKSFVVIDLEFGNNIPFEHLL
jgi:hypothetical protein